MIKKYFRVVLIFVLFFSVHSVANAELIWWDDFESQKLGAAPSKKANGNGVFHTTLGNPGVVDNQHARRGQKSFRAYLNRDRSKLSFRTETVPRGGVDDIRKIPMGEEMWYGFSVYIPEDYVADFSATESIANWHGDNSVLPKKVIRGDGFGANVSLLAKAGRWVVSVFYGEPGKRKQKWWSSELPALSPGSWNDFVFHMKWRSDQSGLVEVWHNGTQYIKHKGKNTYIEEIKIPYFKFGAYKSSWRKAITYNPGDADIRFREYWFDEVRVARGKNGKKSDVDPATYSSR